MINRKLLLWLASVVLPVQLFCMEVQPPPVQVDGARIQQYIRVNNQIRQAEEDLRNVRDYTREYFQATKLFPLAVAASAGAWSLGSYKLLGKMLPARLESLRSIQFLKLIVSGWIGIFGGVSGALGIYLFSEHPNWLGISHAISHRFYPVRQETKNRLHELYRQEAEARPAIIAEHNQATPYIRQLQEQHRQLQEAIDHAQQNHDHAMQQAQSDREQVDNQLHQSQQEFSQLFENYVNHAYRLFQETNENMVNFDIDALLNGLVHYVNQQFIPTRSWNTINALTIEIIEHALQLYVHARNNNNTHQPAGLWEILLKLLEYAVRARNLFLCRLLGQLRMQLIMLHNNPELINGIKYESSILRALASGERCPGCNTVFDENNRMQLLVARECGHIFCWNCRYNNRGSYPYGGSPCLACNNHGT